jgi:hypothetical protein
MPKLTMTVPPEVYEAVQKVCGDAFADSYLSGAVVSEGRLLPRTQLAWSRIYNNRHAHGALRSLKVELVKPPAFDPAIDRLPSQGHAA